MFQSLSMLLGLSYSWKAMLQHGYTPSNGTYRHFHGKFCRKGSGRLLSLLTMPIMHEMHLRHAHSMAVYWVIPLPSAAACSYAQP